MKRAGKSPKTLGERIKWLFTKDGLPVLASILIGFIIGFFLKNGAIGLVVSTLAGFAVLYLFKRLPIRLTPWQGLVTDITPIIGKMCFFMIFLLPVADMLYLPTGQTPNTLTKYLSIVIALPKNLFSKPSANFFPGFAFIVIISVVLMFWGSLNLGKTKGLVLSFIGLLLYTLSPTLTSILSGDVRIRIIMAFFSIGYYLAWVGLILIIAAKFLPRFLKVKPSLPQGQPSMLSFLPPLIGLGVMSHFSSIAVTGTVPTSGAFDFESLHHGIASGFDGGTAGFGSCSIVDDAIEGDDSSGDDGTGYEPEPPPEPEIPAEPPPPQGPQPSTDPEDEPGTTIQHNSDGTITKTLADGTVGTKYTDGTIYVVAPDKSTGTYYPDGTSKEWSPDAGLEVKHPNGDFEKTNADGVSSSLKNNPDGSMDVTSGYGGNLHIPKEGNPTGSLTTYDGTTISMNGDGTSGISNENGKINIDADGNMEGTMGDGKGNKVTFKPDGSMNGETAEGDKITINDDGLKATFKDGSYINTDAEGTPTDAHIKDDEGHTIDIKTDDKGGLHIKDDEGNTADINKDGSGKMKGSDGSELTQDTDGTATATNSEGTKWTAKTDGTGSIADKKGNRIDLGKDGSVTVKTADGKTTTYTPDQINQMKAQGGN